LQYYTRVLALPGAPGRKNKEVSDHPAFYDIYPPGILPLLKQMHRAYPEKEVFVTEMGFSDREDRRRPFWILDTMRYVAQAITEGVPLTGVLYWSLVNNFEWERGMEQKLGLFDERRLSRPLHAGVGVASWEAWEAVAAYRNEPSAATLQKLEALLELARQQHDNE
jgi:beta-glucosidase/6-phospho-beta-glucosidase/beta-galactosidase